MSEQKRVYQHPIGIVLQPYISGGTGEHIPVITGIKGLREAHDVTTITVYNQYVGVPVLLVAVWKEASHE